MVVCARFGLGVRERVSEREVRGEEVWRGGEVRSEWMVIGCRLIRPMCRCAWGWGCHSGGVFCECVFSLSEEVGWRGGGYPVYFRMCAYVRLLLVKVRRMLCCGVMCVILGVRGEGEEGFPGKDWDSDDM